MALTKEQLVIGREYRIVKLASFPEAVGMVVMYLGFGGNTVRLEFSVEDVIKLGTAGMVFTGGNQPGVGGVLLAELEPVEELVMEPKTLTAQDFKLGMRVIAAGKVSGSGDLTGQEGTVVIESRDSIDRMPYGPHEIGVEFDQRVAGGHRLSYGKPYQNHAAEGRGLWVSYKILTPIWPQEDQLELAWSDYLDQDGNPDHKDAFQAGWEAALRLKK